MEENNESIIRTILRNEVTWAIVIIAGIWGFVQTVILPINELQLGITQIQKDLGDIKNDRLGLSDKVTKHGEDIIKLGGRIEAVEKQLQK